MVGQSSALSTPSTIDIFPYSLIAGQLALKLALELAFIAPLIGGVLVSGQRGTGKTTTVRAFARMMYERLPVTLPINATEDRVVGGWEIDALMRGETREQDGLLDEANGTVLYIDEVNLLDDHIVNIILDVTSTGVLVIQREGRNDQRAVSFTLIGTMNPEEGSLRPQLLDRFGLMVPVTAETDERVRAKILRRVLAFDEVKTGTASDLSVRLVAAARAADNRRRARLLMAREALASTRLPRDAAICCVRLASEFRTEGHRGDYVTALAARAHAARLGAGTVTREHIRAVAPLALQHRRDLGGQYDRHVWTPEDDERLRTIVPDA